MFAQVVATEFLKLRRAKVTWFSLVAFSMGPFGVALFMWIVREPGRAAQLGLLGTKADLSGLQATWPSYFSMLTLLVGIGGMLLLAFIVAYVFGREYAEGTAKNLLALPVGRQTFAVAKFVVTAVWWVALVAAVVIESLVLGLALGLPDFSAGLTISAVRNALLAAGLAYLLAPIVAWITTVGRGYMAPLAFAVAMLALGNIMAKTGLAVWFPWSIVPLLIGVVGRPVQTLSTGSFIVLGLTFTAGIAATIWQFIYADNNQ
jgi:ABC-type transport system involved in multi-copper enzyme maturation permease subunit